MLIIFLKGWKRPYIRSKRGGDREREKKENETKRKRQKRKKSDKKRDRFCGMCELCYSVKDPSTTTQNGDRKCMSYRDATYTLVKRNTLYKKVAIYRVVQIKVYDRVCSINQLINWKFFVIFIFSTYIQKNNFSGFCKCS